MADPFASLLYFCQPTSSQAAKLACCPLYEDWKDSEDSVPQPDPAGINADSVRGSQKSAEQQAEDSSVFHTPPEQHLQSFSEDQNPNELCAEGSRTADLGDGTYEVRVLDGQSGRNEIRVPGKKSDGDAAPQDIVSEIRGTEGEASGVEITDLGNVQKTSHEPMRGIMVEKGKRACVSSDIRERSVSDDAEDEILNLKNLCGNKLGKVSKVSSNEKMSKDGNGDKEGRKTAWKRIEEIDEFRFSGWDDVGRRWKETTGHGTCNPSKRKRDLPPSMKTKEKGERSSNVAAKGEKKSGGLHNGKEKNEGGSSVVERMNTENSQLNKDEAKIDRGSNVAGKSEVQSGKIKGGSNEVEKKCGSMDMLDIIKAVLRNMDNKLNDGGDDDDEDILDIVKKRGMKFPRPRWWPPEKGL